MKRPKVPEELQLGIRKELYVRFRDPVTPETLAVVEAILDCFQTLTGRAFTQKRSGTLDAYPPRSRPCPYRLIRGGWRKIFHREFDAVAADPAKGDSSVLSFSDFREDALQEIHCFLALSNLRCWRQDPSELYFLAPKDLPWGAVEELLRFMDTRLALQYAAAGYALADSPRWPPGYNLIFRRLTELPLVNYYEIDWSYDKGRGTVVCPAVMQLLAENAFARLPPPPEGESIHIVPLPGGNCLVHLLDPGPVQPEDGELLARLRALNRWFAPILLQREKPHYIKPEQWEIRRRRFEPPPGSTS